MINCLQMNAAIAKNLVPVSHSVRPEMNREYLEISCPEGWDDVKKLTKKVLAFEGRNFTYLSWNSDRNVCYFSRGLDGSEQIARILNA